MHKYLKKFLMVVKMSVSDAVIYRIDLLIYVLAGIVRPLVFLSLWLATLYSGGKAPLNADQFVSYYLLAMLVGTFVNVWSAPFISSRIRTGRLSPWLLRPFSYIWFDLANNVGEKVFKYLYLVPIIILLGFLFHAKIPNLSLIRAAALIPSLFIAFSLNYAIDLMIGFSAFWTDESSALRDSNDLLSYIFSGWLFPLVLLPSVLQQVSVVLPYRYTLSFPIELLMGTVSDAEILKGLLIASIWLCIIIFGLTKEWQKGIKVYSAVGA